MYLACDAIGASTLSRPRYSSIFRTNSPRTSWSVLVIAMTAPPAHPLLPFWAMLSANLVPRRAAPQHTALHRAAPRRTAPRRTSPHRTSPHLTAPHRTALHRAAPRRTAPPRATPHGSMKQSSTKHKTQNEGGGPVPYDCTLHGQSHFTALCGSGYNATGQNTDVLMQQGGMQQGNEAAIKDVLMYG